jgi:ketosteroid isomerase-like protein
MPTIPPTLQLVLLLAIVACAPKAVVESPAPGPAASPTVPGLLPATADPTTAADELLAADRALARDAAQLDLITALGRVFATDVIMPTPSGHVHGRDSALAALRANAENATSRISWTPIRVGVSSDGLHGFTLGYTTTTRANGAELPGKYIAYWVKKDGAWRAAVHRRVGRPAGAVSLAIRPSSLPTRGLPIGDAPRRALWERELRAAEGYFAAEAHLVGVPEAFRKWGAPDAMNAGPGTAWVTTPDSIAAGMEAAGGPRNTTLVWGSDEVIVASTGDLGVSIGVIRATTAASDTTPASTRSFPFFTIWKRATPQAPWRYVAE